MVSSIGVTGARLATRSSHCWYLSNTSINTKAATSLHGQRLCHELKGVPSASCVQSGYVVDGRFLGLRSRVLDFGLGGDVCIGGSAELFRFNV